MPGPYRIASPPEPPRTDEADSYERMLVAERARDRRTGVLLAVLALTLASIGLTALKQKRQRTPAVDEARHRMEQRVARAAKVIDEASRRSSEEEAQFDADLRRAIETTLSPSRPLTPCSVSLAEPLARGRPSFPLAVVDKGDRVGLFSPSLWRVESDISRAHELLASASPIGAVVFADALEAAPVEARLVRDVVLVRTKYRAPVRSSPTSYEPGVVDGIAYVYDWREHRVTCAGEIHATNAPALEYSFNDGADAKSWQVREPRLDATLEDDLDTQVARAIAAAGALYEIK